MRFLAGEDESAFEDLNETRNSDSERSNRYFSLVQELASKRGIKIDRSARVFRVLINVNRGKSNFQLHAVLADVTSSPQRNPRTSSNSKNKINPRSSRNQKIQYPFRILALKENENLID